MVSVGAVTHPAPRSSPGRRDTLPPDVSRGRLPPSKASPLLRAKASQQGLWEAKPPSSPQSRPSALIWGGVSGTQSLPLWGSGGQAEGPETHPQTWDQAEGSGYWDVRFLGHPGDMLDPPTPGARGGGAPWDWGPLGTLPSAQRPALPGHTEAQDFNPHASVIRPLSVLCVLSVWCVVLVSLRPRRVVCHLRGWCVVLVCGVVSGGLRVCWAGEPCAAGHQVSPPHPGPGLSHSLSLPQWLGDRP